MINVKRYDIDYTKLALERIPQHVQEVEHNSWVQRLVSPFVYIYNQLLLFRSSVLYKLTITPQVVYLEKMLNDRFDSALKRIYILDGLSYNATYLYTKPESKPQHAYTKPEANPLTLFTAGETTQFSFDFVVFVPVAVTFDVDEMKSLLNSYKLAGKYYSIQTF
jgi:hypothetical protein